LKLQDVPHF